MVMWGLARLGCNPGGEWVREILEGSVEEGELGGFRAQHLANLLCAFVKLGYNPGEEWMGLYIRALEARAHQMQELDHFHIQWAWQELNDQYRQAKQQQKQEGVQGVRDDQ
jgi:hypothetical protein